MTLAPFPEARAPDGIRTLRMSERIEQLVQLPVSRNARSDTYVRSHAAECLVIRRSDLRDCIAEAPELGRLLLQRSRCACPM